ncbi:hypothetical protein [Terrarubrum flagellatum]|uniref:hypothetical protein n=1 Tax=Terrirubrum flagellatum TaxID=2895980 RepID=UPI0031453251
MSTSDPKARRATFSLIWMPDDERPNIIDFADAMGVSKTLDTDELIATTTDAIRYAAAAVHPQKKKPWIKAHFATSPREYVVLSPNDIKAAAAKPSRHWTEYA